MVFLDGNFLGFNWTDDFPACVVIGIATVTTASSITTPGTMQKMIVPAGVVSGLLGSLTSMYSFPSLQLS